MFTGLNICSFKKAPTDLTVLKINLELETREEKVHAFLQKCFKEYRGWNLRFFM